MGPSAGISHSAANGEQDALSGYSQSIADFLGEMREKWGRFLAPFSADLSGRQAIQSATATRKTVGSVLALTPSSLRYINDTRSKFDRSTEALKGIVKTSARPVPAIPSLYPTRLMSFLDSPRPDPARIAMCGSFDALRQSLAQPFRQRQSVDGVVAAVTPDA